MKNLLHARIRMILKSTDSNYDTYLKNFKSLYDFEEKDLKFVNETREESENLVIYQVTFTKNRLLNAFLKNLLLKLTQEDKKSIVDDTNILVDNEYNELFLRLDKDNLSLITGGDCIHIKLTLAAYPKNRDSAAKKVIELFS